MTTQGDWSHPFGWSPFSVEPHPSQRPDADLTENEALDWGGGELGGQKRETRSMGEQSLPDEPANPPTP